MTFLTSSLCLLQNIALKMFQLVAHVANKVKGKSLRSLQQVLWTQTNNCFAPHVFFWKDEGACSLAQPSWQAILQSYTSLTIISAFHQPLSLIRYNYLKFLVLFCFPWQWHGIIVSAPSLTATWCYKVPVNLLWNLFPVVNCHTVQWLSS